MFSFKIDDAAKYLALISAGLYAAGFLIVNANLASYGDFDPDFASSRYVFAGFLFVWYLVFVCWIVFKYVHELVPQEANFLKIKENRPLLFWVMVFQTFYLEVALRICVSALSFELFTVENVTSVALRDFPALLLFGIGLALERYFMRKRIWVNQVVLITVQFVALVLSLWTTDFIAKEIIVTYFLATFYFLFLHPEIMKPIKDFNSKATIAYFSMSSIVAVISFGTLIYGHVKHQFGGGLPVSVTVYMKTDVGTSELTKTASGGFLIDMIALNDKKLIGISGGKLAIINADSIASVIYP